jgi:hypothetical protein
MIETIPAGGNPKHDATDRCLDPKATALLPAEAVEASQEPGRGVAQAECPRAVDDHLQQGVMEAEQDQVCNSGLTRAYFKARGLYSLSDAWT